LRIAVGAFLSAESEARLAKGRFAEAETRNVFSRFWMPIAFALGAQIVNRKS
jgi:hypothetical protein